MRLPRKGILIRIVLYGSAISYFGWHALKRYQLEQSQSERAKQIEQVGGIPTFEITPEQARELGIDVDDEGHIVSPKQPAVEPNAAKAPATTSAPGPVAPKPPPKPPATPDAGHNPPDDPGGDAKSQPNRR
ncbi:MAG: hypothetical protein B7733_14835 [Myxococcales bacterium FL481]|nr:MAG: hypothetical protein B7733_14835 [Myxococcales bacterium FL481]